MLRRDDGYIGDAAAAAIQHALIIDAMRILAIRCCYAVAAARYCRLGVKMHSDMMTTENGI